MNEQFAVKPSKLFACVLVACCCLLATESKSDEPGKAKKSNTDSLLGEKAGDVRDGNGLKMKLVWCPAGEFAMGSPKSEAGRSPAGNENQVQVTLTKGFWLGKLEVTQSEWKLVMAGEPWKGDITVKEGDDFPATFVSWNDAIEFCRRLTEREREAGRVPDGWEYTLPTEAQRERACRAGTKTRFSFGDDESKLSEYAWFNESGARGAQVGERYAHQVGQKKPNPWGLCDMHGNVWELCRDSYSKELPGGGDPEVIDKGSSLRVMRGGWYLFVAERCRSAFRGPTDPSKTGKGLAAR
jgi:formylglycine-generating enzyme required for sulfatase activity